MADFIIVQEPNIPQVLEVEKPENKTLIEITTGIQGPAGARGSDGNVNDYDPGDLTVYFRNGLY